MKSSLQCRCTLLVFSASLPYYINFVALYFNIFWLYFMSIQRNYPLPHCRTCFVLYVVGFCCKCFNAESLTITFKWKTCHFTTWTYALFPGSYLRYFIELHFIAKGPILVPSASCLSKAMTSCFTISRKIYCRKLQKNFTEAVTILGKGFVNSCLLLHS